MRQFYTGEGRYPNFKQNHSCIVMLVYNLASPEWININCAEKLLVYTLCGMQGREKRNANLSGDIERWCPVMFLKTNKTCLHILWSNSNQPIMKPFPLKHMLQLNFITNTVKLSPIISISPEYQIFQFDPFLDAYKKTHLHNSYNHTGYRIYLSTVSRTVPGRETFKCANSIFISPLKVCNNMDDCLDKSDELFCTCNPSNDSCLRNIFKEHFFVFNSTGKGSDCSTVAETIRFGQNMFDVSKNQPKNTVANITMVMKVSSGSFLILLQKKPMEIMIASIQEKLPANKRHASTFQTCASTSLIKTIICAPVPMELTFSTAVLLSAISCSSALIITAFHGSMCVTANGIVQREQMKANSVHTTYVKTCSDATGKRAFVFLWEEYAMELKTVQMEKMRFSVK